MFSELNPRQAIRKTIKKTHRGKSQFQAIFFANFIKYELTNELKIRRIIRVQTRITKEEKIKLNLYVSVECFKNRDNLILIYCKDSVNSTGIGLQAVRGKIAVKHTVMITEDESMRADVMGQGDIKSIKYCVDN